MEKEKERERERREPWKTQLLRWFSGRFKAEPSSEVSINHLIIII